MDDSINPGCCLTKHSDEMGKMCFCVLSPSGQYLRNQQPRHLIKTCSWGRERNPCPPNTVRLTVLSTILPGFPCTLKGINLDAKEWISVYGTLATSQFAVGEVGRTKFWFCLCIVRMVHHVPLTQFLGWAGQRLGVEGRGGWEPGGPPW